MNRIDEMNAKRPKVGGPDTALAPEKVSRIRELWERGDTVSNIAMWVGVSASTVHRYTRDMPRQVRKPKLKDADRNRLMRNWA